MLYAKASQFYSEPVKYYIKEEENPPKMHAKSQSSRLFSAFKLVMKNTVKGDLDESTFHQITRFICHPLISADAANLKVNFDFLVKFLGGKDIEAGLAKCGTYFERSSKTIVEECLFKRSGILSPEKLVRTTAANVLICMGWSGHLALYISHMKPVFNYKAIEMLDKMEALFRTGTLDRVPHYELTFFAEMTKDLLKVFHPKDKAIFDTVSGKAFLVKQTAEVVELEEVAPGGKPAKKASAADALAAMMKAKKKAKGKKVEAVVAPSAAFGKKKKTTKKIVQ